MEIKKLIDIRPGKWPSYYDDLDISDYQEYFIKDTNIKLGFKYIDNETNEKCFYCIICDGYDQMDPFDSEKELFKHFKWMFMNKDLSWRYYQ